MAITGSDAVQGRACRHLSKGNYITNIMNFIGYDVATIGNHEFDYGMDQFLALRDMADFPYVSANFCDMDGDTVLELCDVVGDWQWLLWARLRLRPSPSHTDHFQDEDGNYIQLARAMTGRISIRPCKGCRFSPRRWADYVFVLSHLGILDASSPTPPAI
ncbi:MAG: hypothetical protein ACLVJ6_06020 [Merdibacter sp.]